MKHCAVLSSGKKAHHWKCIDMIVRLWVVNLKLTGKLVRFLAYLVDPHLKHWVQILFEGDPRVQLNFLNNISQKDTVRGEN